MQAHARACTLPSTFKALPSTFKALPLAVQQESYDFITSQGGNKWMTIYGHAMYFQTKPIIK